MEKDISLRSFYMEEMGKLGLSLLKSFAALTVKSYGKHQYQTVEIFILAYCGPGI